MKLSNERQSKYLQSFNRHLERSKFSRCKSLPKGTFIFAIVVGAGHSRSSLAQTLDNFIP
jgi:hypothetical protein